MGHYNQYTTEIKKIMRLLRTTTLQQIRNLEEMDKDWVTKISKTYTDQQWRRLN